MFVLQIEFKEIDEEIDSAIKGLGIDISRPEKGSDQDDRDRAASRRWRWVHDQPVSN